MGLRRHTPVLQPPPFPQDVDNTLPAAPTFSPRRSLHAVQVLSSGTAHAPGACAGWEGSPLGARSASEERWACPYLLGRRWSTL